MKSMTLTCALAATVLGAAFASGAQASTVWDNGGPGSAAGFCSSNTFTCGSAGWNIYDDFQLSLGTQVTGFTYDSNFSSFGSVSDYVSTKWSIWSADPRSTFGAGPLASGTAVGVNSVDGSGFTLTTVTGLNVALGAGTYWLGLSNNVDNNQITTYVLSGGSKLGAASQSDNAGNFFNARIDDASFTIQGSAGVPEPATWALMIGGFGLAGAALRRRRTAIAA
jgi:hypothetical protein